MAIIRKFSPSGKLIAETVATPAAGLLYLSLLAGSTGAQLALFPTPPQPTP